MAAFKEVTQGLKFPEGPIAMSDGSVVLVEIQRGTLTRVQPDGTKKVVADCGGGPNGAAVGPDGCVYVCNNGGFEWHEVAGLTLPGLQPPDYAGGKIQKVDLGTGQVQDLYTECGGIGLRGPNDIVFDAEGGFWFTDHGKNRERHQGGDLPARGPERNRSFARRAATVRSRDPDRSSLRMGYLRAR
jgi:gluconolactonase